jgi:hypothetical protein
MPRIASFEGIVVVLCFGDHPPPHVHVRVGRPGHRGVAEARFAIDTGAQIDGVLPAVKAARVARWCQRNRQTLLADWERAQRDLHPIGRYD